MLRQLSCLNRQKWLHLLVLVLLLKDIDGGISDIKSQCSGYNVCIEYDATRERYSTVYWYEKASNKCLLLGRRCVKPNRNNTFNTLSSCQEICKNEISNNDKAPECGKGGKECEQEIPPNSNTTTKPSLSPIIAVVCAIGGIALVAIVVAGAFMVKRRKKIQKRRYVEEMLHMWSSNSDDSYDSYDDNPEDNNLFDRLERNW